MKKQIKKLAGTVAGAFLCLIFALALTGKPSLAAEESAVLKASEKSEFGITAASKNKKAKNAFKKFLSKEKIQWSSDFSYPAAKMYFDYYEVGKKKTPVLIVMNPGAAHYEGYMAAFQYINGKVVKVLLNDGISCYVKSGVLVTYHSGGGYGEEHTYYHKVKPSGTSSDYFAYTAILDDDWGSEARKLFGDDVYEWNSKKVTKKKFNSNLSSIIGKEKLSSFARLENTAANRNKYLK